MMCDQAWPPYSFGQAGATQPLAASFLAKAICSGQFSWLVGRTGPAPRSLGSASARNARTSWRRALCSAVNLNSMLIPPCERAESSLRSLPQGKGRCRRNSRAHGRKTLPLRTMEPEPMNIFFDVDNTIITWDVKLRPGVHEVFARLREDGH